MNEWERQPNESYPAYEAFEQYLNERSYPAVAKSLSKSLTLIKRWGRINRWRERADAYDNEIKRKAMDKAADDYAAMIERQIKIGMGYQVKAANAVQQMDLTGLPVKYLPALIEMTKTGVKIERSARELKRDEPQENLFVKTLEKISRRIEDDD